MQRPTYLRVMITSACAMGCAFCHAEGLRFDPLGAPPPLAESLNRGQRGMPAPTGRLSPEALEAAVLALVGAGIRKVKLLGGEPLLAPNAPGLIRRLKDAEADLDVSMITSGAAPLSRLKACIDAGMDRANLSIHGWGLDAFRRHGAPALFAQRQAIFDHLLAWGRPLKLNYVYTGPEVEGDLAALLRDAAALRSGAPLVVSVLDDLNNPAHGPDVIRALLERLEGPPVEVRVEEDPLSLPTERRRLKSGLWVEIKSQRLGEVAPWSACAICPRRARCREGIFALRLSPGGLLKPCADRPDLGLDLGALPVEDIPALAGVMERQITQWLGKEAV